jgi:clusterin-associated protein 1
MGQKLFQLLNKETDSKFNREKALSILTRILKEYNQSSKNIEKYIEKLMSGEENHVVELENFLQSLKNKKSHLEDQIKEKNLELERSEKKLKSLTSIKPAYLEEIEVQEEVLDKLFKVYVEKVRNLDYLENIFDQVNLTR